MTTQWSLDFCLVCDQQISGNEAYCSQGCRLADLDQHSSTSASAYPRESQLRSERRDNQITSAPPLAVAASRRQTIGKHLSSPRRGSLAQTNADSQSSSVESSSSLLASPSNQVKHELHDYTGYFDQVRDWKRRLVAS
ncbi:hypothetical protein BGW36DRAFT_302945 [Talaromyces proteolyticus]|uniref:Uncharacterized protein n=1 Tax=Talaromyces proteolyticus TaxID=1131652 RepID=A0AAD4KJV3_9EURO|nr:uncharacterized protein BGW36DRAFT_302945 [Talaromyces proteolyticus]KAH8693095.1 hypothetical protein BGW36DRAFT_302945 [Talaromyces proteolyticus]